MPGDHSDRAARTVLSTLPLLAQLALAFTLEVVPDVSSGKQTCPELAEGKPGLSMGLSTHLRWVPSPHAKVLIP